MQEGRECEGPGKGWRPCPWLLVSRLSMWILSTGLAKICDKHHDENARLVGKGSSDQGKASGATHTACAICPSTHTRAAAQLSGTSPAAVLPLVHGMAPGPLGGPGRRSRASHVRVAMCPLAVARHGRRSAHRLPIESGLVLLGCMPPPQLSLKRVTLLL